MPSRNWKGEGGGRFLDLASTGPERFAVKPVPRGRPGPAPQGRAVFINRTRYGPAGVDGPLHIAGVFNGNVEEVLLVTRAVTGPGPKPFS